MPEAATPTRVADALRDPVRLAALRGAELLDAAPEERFDQLARVAAKPLDAPIALVSLIGDDRQFFKGCFGSVPEPHRSRRETPLSHSFCQHVVALKDLLFIEDARAHPLFQDSPAVRELGLVAYIGVPLATPEGHVLGTLCVLDTEPRRWGPDQVEAMRALAAATMRAIGYRSAARAAGRGDGQASMPGDTGPAPLSRGAAPGAGPSSPLPADGP